MTTAYTSLLGLALPVTGELSGTWGDTVNTAITSLLDTAVAGTTSITTDADITLTTTTGASNQARQAILLWNPASGTTTRYITAPAQSKLYTVINASGGTQSIVIRGVGPTTGVTIAKGESAMVAWNGSDFVKVSSSGGAITFTDLTVTGNTILGDAAADTLTVNATSTFASPVNFQGLVKLPSTGRSAAAALTVTAPAFLYGVASTYTDTTSSGTIGAMAPFYSIAQPTLSTSNVTTYTNASTLYIANAPAAGGSATITNPYALYVAAGAAYFGGGISGSTVFNDGTANGVMYLNASKQITTGSALTFDGSTLYNSGNISVGGNSGGNRYVALLNETNTYTGTLMLQAGGGSSSYGGAVVMYGHSHASYPGGVYVGSSSGTSTGIIFGNGGIAGPATSEWMRLNATGLGVGISPSYALDVKASGTFNVARFAGQVSSVSTYIYTDTAYWAFGDGASYTGQLYGGHAINKTLSMYTDSVERVIIGATGTLTIVSGGLNLGSGGANGYISGGTWYGINGGDWNFQAGNASQNFVWKNSSGSNLARITSAGELVVGATNTGVGKLVSYYSSTAADPLSPANAGLNVWGNSSVRLLFGTDANSPYAAYIQASNTGSGFPISLNPSGGDVAIGSLSVYNGGGFGKALSIYGSTSAATSYASSSRQYQVGINTDSRLGIYDATGAAYRLLVATTGEIAVGATPVQYKGQLQVGGAGNDMIVGSQARIGGNSNSGFFGVNGYYDQATATGKFLNNGFFGQLDFSVGTGIWVLSATATSGTAGANLAAAVPLITASEGDTVALQGATQSTGTGITFPATQNASSNANTLDDYEEGSWTPTFAYNVTNPTVSGYVQVGWYVKVGRLVTVYCDVEASSINGGSGNGIIEGLPFTVASSPARNYPIPTFRDCTAVGSGGANTIVCGFTQPNTTYVYIQYQGTDGSYGAAGTVGWNSSGRVTFAVTYLAAN